VADDWRLVQQEAKARNEHNESHSAAALDFLAGHRRAYIEQKMIGPCGVADVREERLFSREHAKSIYGRRRWRGKQRQFQLRPPRPVW